MAIKVYLKSSKQLKEIDFGLHVRMNLYGFNGFVVFVTCLLNVRCVRYRGLRVGLLKKKYFPVENMQQNGTTHYY